MRVAVITPYYKEPNELLEQCRASVLDQTVACDQVFVADGFPNAVVGGWHAKHFILPNAHGDAGNMGRVIGSLSAFAQGYDAVAFLDADNWYRPDHIQRLLELHRRTGAAVCTSRRSMHRADGSYMSHVLGEPENIAYLTLFFESKLIAHIHVNWLAPVKVRRTLIGGSNKMVVYDDLEPSEKIKVYDKGITLNPNSQAYGEKVHQMMVGYRSGDMATLRASPSTPGRSSPRVMAAC